MSNGDNSLSLPQGYSSDVVLDRSEGPEKMDVSGVPVLVKRVTVRSVDSADADLELALRMLPAGFLDWYLRLVDDGLKTGREGLQSEDGRPAGVGVGRAHSPVPLRSEAAVDQRSRVDRKLRKLGREIQEWYSRGAKPSSRRCAGSRCRRLGEGEWLYCPNCGSRMEEVK